MTKVSSNTDDARGGWTVDRKIPFALLFAIFLQTIAIAVLGGQLVLRVEIVEKTLQNTIGALEVERRSRQLQDNAQARLEERIASMNKLLEKIDRKVDGN